MQNYHIIHLSSTDSTNNYLKQLANTTKLEEGTVILSDFQTKGRGQGGNHWYAQKDKNLLFSVLLYPDLPADDFFSLSTLFSLAICATLRNFGVEPQIKWPNDIYVRDRKIAGILVENSFMGRNISRSILGAGINVNEEAFPSELPNPVSIRNILDREIPITKVLETFKKHFSYYHASFVGKAFDNLLEEYNTMLYRKGSFTSFTSENGNFRAEIIEVRRKGQLVLRNSVGEEKEYLFGEVKMQIPQNE